MSKYLVSLSPESLNMTAGLLAAIGTATLAATEAYPELIGMGAVAAATMAMIARRSHNDAEERQRERELTASERKQERDLAADREKLLMSRVSKLEDDASAKLTGLIERQLQCAIKQDAAMVHLSDTLDKLIEGQKAMDSIIKKFAADRPCLMKEHLHNLGECK